jgi:hypothetical protein
MECSICFEDITKQTGSVVLSCEHPFHLRCITKWFFEQGLKDLPETCPCCRSEGTQLDRTCLLDEASDEEEEDDDESYEEEEQEDEDIESLNDLAREIQQGLFRLERQPSGEWVIQNNQELAFDSFRSMFGPLNQLDEVDESPVVQRFSLYHWRRDVGIITRPASNREVRFLEDFVHTNRERDREEAATKIQAFFRGNQVRNTHNAAVALMRLFQQAYNL